MSRVLHDTAPASVEMPAASTLALHDAAMAIKPCPFAYWNWRIANLERVMGCLLDHYLSDYGQDDGGPLEGQRDALGLEAERLVPNWRECRDEYNR